MPARAMDLRRQASLFLAAAWLSEIRDLRLWGAVDAHRAWWWLVDISEAQLPRFISERLYFSADDLRFFYSADGLEQRLLKLQTSCTASTATLQLSLRWSCNTHSSLAAVSRLARH
jgi:hypothetical protein